jgi:hypothetical protein
LLPPHPPTKGKKGTIRQKKPNRGGGGGARGQHINVCSPDVSMWPCIMYMRMVALIMCG